MRLMGKLFINGKIRALTGLSIGGSKTDVAIGDIDNCVIKTSEGVPYIPGSSLKGKIRSLLEKSEMEAIMEKNKKSDTGLCNCGRKDCKICVVFGNSGDKRSKEAGPTRLVIRDCHLTPETRRKMEEKEGEFRELELIYTESKWENVINRLTSRAEHPRQTERVPRGAEFDFEMVFDFFEKEDIDRFYYFISGLNLLEDDYLGGSGSRGYGRIEFRDVEISLKSIEDYQGTNQRQVLYTGMLEDFLKQRDTFERELLNKLGAE
ncbi:MAG: type III-A CRISPR-associated RAMP protein Csm3 [Tepidanaerobacteraceae bacterium]|jgi:CRISPR-associated protein Csm3|nr:type III-A CRISPR-associated RAMP protein Csm3 [Tepidanaerobacter sp.]HQE05890.1 type III-A CRISPR-associated RAMP protein Csm3 [Tepidanaerobacteraceae bacterium]